MGAPLVALALAGSVINAAGAIESAKEEARSLLDQNNLDSLRLEEIVRRSRINQESVIRSAAVFQGQQLASIAGSGASVSGGSVSLQALEDTASKASREISNIRLESEFELDMAQRTMDSRTDAANRVRRAGNRAAFASILGGSAKAFSASKG